MSHTSAFPDLRAVGTLLVDARRHEDAALVTLHGEADVASLHHLEYALDRLDLEGVALVTLDLAPLEFADGATVRGLATFARGARRGGHAVRTRGASRTLRRLADVMGVREVLGLR